MSEAALLDEPPVTVGGFDAFLGGQADPRPWELVAGRIVGMTNPNTIHEQIVSNIGLRLKQAADSAGAKPSSAACRFSDPRTREPSTSPALT